MDRLQLEVRVARSPELAAHDITLATRALGASDRVEARRLYAGMGSVALHHSASWSNLAALAIGLGDPASARGHAQRALELDRGSADAWINFGVASWHLQQPGCCAGHGSSAATSLRSPAVAGRRNAAASTERTAGD